MQSGGAGMDPISAIVGALVAGATAAASDTASQVVKDAYQGLKTLLIDTYNLVSTPMLEKKPSSSAAQEAVEEEIRDTPAIAADPAPVLEKAKALQDALSQEPQEKLATLGIDIKRLEAGGNLIAERIRGGIRGDDWSAKGDVRISDVSGGGTFSGNA